MPVLLPTHRAALALGEPFKQAGFMVHVHWVAIKLDDILIIREVLKTSNIKYVIHICFSASNMQFIARKFPYGLIVADNDNSHVGEITARKTGKPYWISSAIGEDFNDFHKRVGTFQASQALKKKLIEIGSLVI
jgi:hypothetical protein